MRLIPIMLRRMSPFLARLGRFDMSAQWSLLGVKQTFSE
jgi:hypothetical protein